jgi:hypothetical protein
VICSLLAAGLLAACSLTDVPDPSTIVDPGVVQTPDGAVGLYHGSITGFAAIFGGTAASNVFIQRGNSYVLANGFAGDEYSTDSFDNLGEFFMQRSVDPAEGHDLTQPYSDLHTARLNIDQAIGSLRAYGKTTPPSYIGELFALKGYLYLMFGEMYCSGVPFSRAVYGGDIVLGQPETTTQMYNDAIAQFDTALAVTTDSARIKSLAYVGKARALVDLGQFSDAAAVATAANVPTTFTYTLTYSAQTFPNFFYSSTNTSGFSGGPSNVYMGNREGTNGLPYVEAGDPASPSPDPRVAWVAMSGGFDPTTYPVPAKYTSGSAPITLSSGIEARLIEAEAALQAHDVTSWAAILDDLRQNASTPAIPPLPADSTTAATDTLRENVMFRERAFWLYGTGHRLGDMRRLVRQYHHAQQLVFPQGNMFPNDQSVNMYYASNTNFVPPREEQTNNPYYHGCLNRDP